MRRLLADGAPSRVRIKATPMGCRSSVLRCLPRCPLPARPCGSAEQRRAADAEKGANEGGTVCEKTADPVRKRQEGLPFLDEARPRSRPGRTWVDRNRAGEVTAGEPSSGTLHVLVTLRKIHRYGSDRY
jgi:hypothetical protein